MLIKIGTDLGRIADLNAAEIDALENIGSVAFYGYHLILGKRASLNALSFDARLSKRARAAFAAAVARAADMQAVERLVERKLIVSDTFLEPRAIDGGSWEVPLSRLSSAAILGAPAVLAENLVDAQFYCALGTLYRWHKGARTLSMSCVPMGGGGSTLARELEARRAREGTITLCIVDSDRKFLSDQVGQTARLCRLAHPEGKWFIELLVLECKEAENLLPPAWIAATQVGRQMPQAVDTLRGLYEHGATFFVYYADRKDAAPACHYVDSTTQEVRINARNDLARITYMSRRIADCHQRGECNASHCLPLPAFGPTILEQVVAWLSRTSPKEAREILDDKQLFDLAKMVFEWGVSLPKQRV